ncbi:hypothetical protein LOOC260_113010 [Paucilactobacillus hokkaidonensis JCM 18461]|uniref:Uncharacterized protein n=2 Tax=Paucilactobacillus hokkaidonensis TaxID=1193095 RepID=A0A0A1GY25_9LACO|nr:hypothetical protein [Paucilactobacillus hokkaidonensis]KRO08894.1 hypothetical protein IV59_GL001022 [Paucilactobacillus hokkaidonensis]BAP85838.1 hypothetical protein LOOC260_113010 [Paucilactobacillus hokkaidonensis JCM 18461]
MSRIELINYAMEVATKNKMQLLVESAYDVKFVNVKTKQQTEIAQKFIDLHADEVFSGKPLKFKME